MTDFFFPQQQKLSLTKTQKNCTHWKLCLFSPFICGRPLNENKKIIAQTQICNLILGNGLVKKYNSRAKKILDNDKKCFWWLMCHSCVPSDSRGAITFKVLNSPSLGQFQSCHPPLPLYLVQSTKIEHLLNNRNNNEKVPPSLLCKQRLVAALTKA